VNSASGDRGSRLGIERAGNGFVSRASMGDLAGSGTHVWALDMAWHGKSWTRSERGAATSARSRMRDGGNK
jgi:hypothetical protein